MNANHIKGTWSTLLGGQSNTHLRSNKEQLWNMMPVTTLAMSKVSERIPVTEDSARRCRQNPTKLYAKISLQWL